ncbi:MAG: AAA family ATPase, partial [Muribaculaceae bacterium]|nr:AAA family ATPase [Muribaculaceae bacterium]
MAPTGRAAKVMGNLAGDGKNAVKARTIHTTIYSFKGLNQDLTDREVTSIDETGQMFLTFEPTSVDSNAEAMVHIIDEASMVSDFETKDVTQARFGSGKLLTDLLNYDNNPDSKFIMVGDPCQLPPVEQYYSPALMEDYIACHFGCGVATAQLTEIMRQAGDSTIITASKAVRTLWANAPAGVEVYGASKVWGKLPLRNYSDIQFHHDVNDLVELYVKAVKGGGYERAVFISRSNSRCSQFSLRIRSRLGFTSPTVAVGDLLMVTQNNLLLPLVNGDMVEVTEVTDRVTRRAGLGFRLVAVKELFSGNIYKTWLIEDILYQNRPNLDKVQQTDLIIDFVNRMKALGVKQKSVEFNLNSAERNSPASIWSLMEHLAGREILFSRFSSDIWVVSCPCDASKLD